MTTTKMKSQLIMVLLGATMLTAISALADLDVQNPGLVDFQMSTPGYGYYFANDTEGYAFHMNTSYTGRYLGFWDQSSGDPLAHSHDVGIWDSSGNLVVSGTVPADGFLAVPANGGEFRWVEVPSFTLAAGQDYVIGAKYSYAYYGDIVAANVATVTTDPAVTYLGGRFGGYDAPLTRPTRSDYTWQQLGYFGPNFAAEVTPVPEPSTCVAGVLLLLPFGASALQLLRKKQTPSC